MTYFDPWNPAHIAGRTAADIAECMQISMKQMWDDIAANPPKPQPYDPRDDYDPDPTAYFEDDRAWLPITRARRNEGVPIRVEPEWDPMVDGERVA